jgi:hypothetical protein
VWLIVVTGVLAVTSASTATAFSLRADPLARTAQLLPSDRQTGSVAGQLFASTGISGGVVVAGAPLADVGSSEQQGEVYVFTEPAGGWSTETETARLVESDGQAGDHFGTTAAISGGTVVVGGESLTGRMVLDVFRQPPGGWSGTLTESAQLSLPSVGDAALTSIGISKDTIVIGTRSGTPAGYVFTQPNGGWSGTVQPSATLTIPDGSYPCFEGQTSVAIDGATIAAACSGHAYVFDEPTAGWSGPLMPSATLVGPSAPVVSVAVTGTSIVATGDGGQQPGDPVVFDEPSSGWSGTVQPTATLNVPRRFALGWMEHVAASRAAVAALLIPEDSNDCAVLPSCQATIVAFSEPPGGWRATNTGAITSLEQSIAPLAIEGNTIAAGGVEEIDLFHAHPGPPSAGKVSLTGVGIGEPRLRVTVDAGEGAAPMRSLKLSLPRGVHFTTAPNDRERGVHTSAPTRAITLTGHRLTLGLKRAVGSLSVTVTPPALTADPNLVTRARTVDAYNRHHQRKRRLTLKARCSVQDAAGHVTRLGLTLKLG